MQPSFRDQDLKKKKKKHIWGSLIEFITFLLETFFSLSQGADVGRQTWEIPQVKSESDFKTQRARRARRETERSRLVGGRFNKQGDLHARLVLCGHKPVDLCAHLPES